MKAKAILAIGLSVLILCLLIVLGNGYLQNRALFAAIEESDYDSAQAAIKYGAFVDLPRHFIAIPEIVMTNPTPLIAACKEGNQDIITLLLEHGADINKYDNCTGETPLLAALQGTKQNRFSLAFLLIENGADIHMVQPGANSALQETLLVSEHDSEDTIAEGFLLFQYLIEQNVDKAIPLPWESTLTYAVHYRNYNVVDYLLKNKIFGVDDCDANGNTALIVAAKYNREDIVELLMDYGANTTLTDEDGNTAMDYAVQNGNEEIQKLLKQAEDTQYN